MINIIRCEVTQSGHTAPNTKNSIYARYVWNKNIEGYDTWIFEDGSRLMGEPSFESMSEKSGCPLPE